MEVVTRSLVEFETEARRFAAGLIPHANENGATIVCPSGELGAGKTTFTQIVAKELGVTETVNSPTFVIEKIYELAPEAAHGFGCLVHIDAYRLKGSHELAVLGWNDLVADHTNLILVEWAEHIADAVPETALRIQFKESGNDRIITYDKTN